MCIVLSSKISIISTQRLSLVTFPLIYVGGEELGKVGCVNPGQCTHSWGKTSTFYTICFQVTANELEVFNSGCIKLLYHILPQIWKFQVYKHIWRLSSLLHYFPHLHSFLFLTVAVGTWTKTQLTNQPKQKKPTKPNLPKCCGQVVEIFLLILERDFEVVSSATQM